MTITGLLAVTGSAGDLLADTIELTQRLKLPHIRPGASRRGLPVVSGDV